MGLIYKALDDYIAQRYHSCIPIVLMMIDGFVNDIEQKGFFATGVDLTVWDTIAAHSSGLNSLTKIFGSSRKKTTSEDIFIPYRNGILHGRDLGYANKKVAAKSWSALVALGDWARAVKSGKNKEKKDFKPPTFTESIESLKESLTLHQKVQIEKRLIAEWKPRKILINSDVPEKGDVEVYDQFSPERTVVEFIHYLLKANYGGMAQLITKLYRTEESVGKLAGQIRSLMAGKVLVDYRLTEIRDDAPAISEVDVILVFKKKGDQLVHERTFRLIYQDEDCNPHVRNYAGGAWKILFNCRY